MRSEECGVRGPESGGVEFGVWSAERGRECSKLFLLKLIDLMGGTVLTTFLKTGDGVGCSFGITRAVDCCSSLK